VTRTPPVTVKPLIASEGRHVRHLQQRLAEAEATIQALLSGQIDAVVDARNGTPVLLAKAQEALKQSEERFREQAALLDIAHDAIYVRDLDGRITYWNKGAERAYGWAAHEAVGRKVVDLLCTEPSQLQQAEASLLVDGEWHGEVVKRTKSKGEVVMAVRWTAVRNEQGQPTSVLAINTDITLQKRAMDTVRAADERMRFVLEAAGVGIWDLDFRTGVLQWSEILEAQHGLQPRTFGRTLQAFMERVHPEDRDAVFATMKAHQSGGNFSIQHRTLWPDGTVRWLSGAGRIEVGPQGEQLRGVGISLDVTERHMLEAQYQQAQKMEAVGRLASGVAHDFNNLLTVILGFAELITADVDVASQHSMDLDEVIKAARRATALTKQLLAFSRQQMLHATPLDVNGLITDMMGMLARLIGEDVQVALTLAPGLSPALVDRGQLEQVVMNLVVNARDAMPSGGSVAIETADVTLEPSFFHQTEIVPGSYVMLAVTDTGGGMTKEVQRRLFEPFFTTKESGKGTGLGLSTTYGIVKQSRGYIWVYSEIGEGTTFKVYLPRATAEIAPAVSSPVLTVPAEHHWETVLLVEDEVGVRLLSKRILENAGYRVLEAENGDDAEKMFGHLAGSIDLLVTDVMMPVCGGPELFRRLQRHAPALRVLYMSGYTEQSAVSNGGVDPDLPYVQKPFTTAGFVRHVREALDRQAITFTDIQP
jgi:two-component system, cell cycle sensor histidine kinase and response regulator CckA